MKQDELRNLLGQLGDSVTDVYSTQKLVDQYRKTSSEGHEGGPYSWQVNFHQMGADSPERAIIAANQTGKTRSAAAEVAIHMTGLYPDWWKGRRFKEAPETICAGQTNEDVRDIQQLALFGRINERKQPDGTGWVPLDCIAHVGFRQCGVQNVIDTVHVKHASGKTSTCTMKSYEQGWEKFQGRICDLIWLDEEPDHMRLFTECQTRVLVRNGLILFTATPLKGMSDIVRHFMDGIAGVNYVTATWEDAAHLSTADREAKAARYPAHERDTRTKGIPMMGTGLVYPVPDELILCERFEIPDYYRRICGIDFGIDHPAAAAWICHDPDSDIMYLYDCYAEKGQTPAYHAQAIMGRGKWIPVAWPHDGMARDKGSGVPLAHQYRDRGVNILGEPASWDADLQSSRGYRAQSREAGAVELLERMHTGRFKVFDVPQNKHFLDEIRMLHRKDGQIVPTHDDVESAVRYAIMMIRCAVMEDDMNRLPTRQKNDYDPLAAFSSRR